MNDKLIFTDGHTLYITLESKIRNWVKWGLIALNLVLYAVPVILLISAEKEEFGRLFFGASAMATAFYFVITRPTLWNVFGRECMIITKDNFSYYRDFGLYKTPVQNIVIERGIAVFYDNVFVFENETYVLIHFFEYLPNEEYREILSTSIKTPEKNYEKIVEYLEELFNDPEDVEEQPFGFSLN